MGRIELNCFAQHPLSDQTVVIDFPVLPIAFRVGTSGPTAIGRRYEVLVKETVSFRGAHSAFGTDALLSQSSSGVQKIQSRLRELVGAPTEAGEFPLGTLLSEVIARLIRQDLDLDVFVKACGLMLRVAATG
jgi:hypothetical protein